VDGWLLHSALTHEQQEELYTYTVALGKGTAEEAALADTSGAVPKHASPLAFHQLVYTGGSNCALPTKWIECAKQAWAAAAPAQSGGGFDGLHLVAAPAFNSVYAQLFGADATMAPHRDAHVTWGISVNLGATCRFRFGNATVMLRSGDILIADFSAVTHAVEEVFPATAPGWFNDEVAPTFGRVRCSVQIREVRPVASPISMDEFMGLLRSGKGGAGDPAAHGSADAGAAAVGQ
jgi:hypothetical protein